MRIFSSICLTISVGAAVAPVPMLAATLPIGFFTGTDFQYATIAERGGRGEVLRAGAGGGTGGYTNGTGEVLTLNGGTDRPDMIIGGKPDGDPVGGNGFALLTGEGSGIRMLGNGDDPSAFVGEFSGSGMFTVRDGAFLEMEDLTDIPRSRPNRNTSIHVGTDNSDRGLPGFGTFTMSDGSVSLKSSVETFIEIGFGTGSIGTWTMTNGSELLMRQTDVVGLGSDGSKMNIGDQGGTGSFSVVESSVAIESDGVSRLALGRDGGIGVLSISGGGSMDVTGAAQGVIEIGDSDPSIGETSSAIATVTGPGSRLSASSQILVGSQSDVDGVSALLIANDGAAVEAPEILVGRGGVLGGDGGSFFGNVTIGSGGILAAGASPGLTTIFGDLVLDGGLLEVEIGGTDPLLYDRTVVSGSVIASSAFEIVLDFVDGFVPSAGNTFDFLTASSFDDSFFANVTISTRGFPGSVDVFLGDTNGGGLSLTVASVAPVPLPASSWLLAVGIALVGWLGRRRQSISVSNPT